jgi:hypothetical protein
MIFLAKFLSASALLLHRVCKRNSIIALIKNDPLIAASLIATTSSITSHPLTCLWVRRAVTITPVEGIAA